MSGLELAWQVGISTCRWLGCVTLWGLASLTQILWYVLFHRCWLWPCRRWQCTLLCLIYWFLWVRQKHSWEPCWTCELVHADHVSWSPHRWYVLHSTWIRSRLFVTVQLWDRDHSCVFWDRWLYQRPWHLMGYCHPSQHAWLDFQLSCLFLHDCTTGWVMKCDYKGYFTIFCGYLCQ